MAKKKGTGSKKPKSTSKGRAAGIGIERLSDAALDMVAGGTGRVRIARTG